MAGSPENSRYYQGRRDEAEKILKMFQVEFQKELNIVGTVLDVPEVTNVETQGEVL